MMDELAKVIEQEIRDCVDGPPRPGCYGNVERIAAAVRSFLLSEERVEAAARGLATHDRIEICSDATYRLSTYGPKARAALTAAIGEDDRAKP